MRRLITKEEEEKHKKRNRIAIGIFLAFVMILSTIGFALQSNPGSTSTGSEEKVTYNGITFVYQNGFWTLGSLVFSYNPNQLPEVSIGTLNSIDSYKAKPLYMSSENDDAKNEIYVNMVNFASRIQEACVEGAECQDTTLPVKSCDENLVIIEESNSTMIRQDRNCVYIQGSKEELVKLADVFLFRTMGIK